MKKSTRLFTKPDAFIDTSGFYALLIAGDRSHAHAAKLLDRAPRASVRFVTTDYVLDETATLLRAAATGESASASSKAFSLPPHAESNGWTPSGSYKHGDSL